MKNSMNIVSATAGLAKIAKEHNASKLADDYRISLGFDYDKQKADKARILNCMYQNQHLIANSYIDTLLQVAPTVFVCLHLRELFFYNHRHNYNRHSYLK